MRDSSRGLDARPTASWPGWCCSYCSAPLEPRAHGLYCEAEGRWFATDRGIHRLLPEERRREIQPFLELYQRVRRDEGFRAQPGLPAVPAGHPQAAVWRARARAFREGLAQATARLGPPPWSVLEVGAGCCWAGARLVERGHRVVAVDVNLDTEDGLLAADRVLSVEDAFPRAEADMESLPIEPGVFQLVLATGALHYASRLSRTLVELRRVTRRGGVLLVLDSPVYRRRPDGEAMVATRMKEQARRYGIALPRESHSNYFVIGELQEVFQQAGWQLDVFGWPRPAREWGRDLWEIVRWGRRTARFPILLGTRDG